MRAQGGQIDESGMKIFVPAEFNDINHKRGIVSMARSMDPNSASSQFFICVVDTPHLNGKYSAFGEVIEGMDVVDKIVSAPKAETIDRRTGRKGPGSQPLEPVTIKKTSIEKRNAG